MIYRQYLGGLLRRRVHLFQISLIRLVDNHYSSGKHWLQ